MPAPQSYYNVKRKSRARLDAEAEYASFYPDRRTFPPEIQVGSIVRNHTFGPLEKKGEAAVLWITADREFAMVRVEETGEEVNVEPADVAVVEERR